MSKQKHDIGNKKRNIPAPAEKQQSTDRLAADLVKRGLASNLILDRGHLVPMDKRQGW